MPGGYYGGDDSTSPCGNRSIKQVEREKLTPDSKGVIFAMVGLPARGKSFISRKMERFLGWRGLNTRLFNVGKYRRDADNPEMSGRSEFFSDSNSDAQASREAAAEAAILDVLAFLDGDGEVAIFDATNSTVSRRQRMRDIVAAHHRQYSLIFIEVTCDDHEVVDKNLLNKVKNSPDFAGLNAQEALVDLRARIAHYESRYETVRDDEGSYIKLFNLSSKVTANACYGRISKSVLPYLMAIHLGTRPIWLVRAGSGKEVLQSLGSTDSDSGSDSSLAMKRDCTAKLSNAGRGFAARLAEFVRERVSAYWRGLGKDEEETAVMTSTMPRAVASLCYTTLRHEQTPALNPINKGSIGDGWWDVECDDSLPPWKELQRRHPEFYEKWIQDPLNTRFPGGESYRDLMARLELFFVEATMTTRPLLVVSHVTVLQMLIAYFRDIPISDSWSIPVPKDTVFEMTPTLGGGFKFAEYPLAGSAEPAPSEKEVLGDDGPAPSSCVCGNVFMPDAIFCRKCGQRRAMEGAKRGLPNGSQHAMTSAGPISTEALPKRVGVC